MDKLSIEVRLDRLQKRNPASNANIIRKLKRQLKSTIKK